MGNPAEGCAFGFQSPLEDELHSFPHIPPTKSPPLLALFYSAECKGKALI